jgi:hypothetical protein
MKAKSCLAVALTLLVAAASVVRAGDWRTYTPLPADISIEEPRAEEGLNPKIARLSGVWQGEWPLYGVLRPPTGSGVGRRTTIVIERISGPTVLAIYSVESYGSYSKGGWARILGRVEGKDRIVFRIQGQQETKITLRLVKENVAFAELEVGSYYLKADLERKGQGEERAPAPAEQPAE